MKKTFTMQLPDRAGALLAVSEIIYSLGLNIISTSYNKAVDTHMLFLRVEGEKNAIDEAEMQLKNAGYLLGSADTGKVILIEFELPDTPGSFQPVLRLIDSYDLNISYISSQKEMDGYQRLRLGLFVENDTDISEFIRKASEICKIDIVDYDGGEQVLDNTVFYMTFASSIAKKLGLTDKEKMNLIVNSNRIMELLSDKPEAQYKTFGYVREFAEKMHIYHGENFDPRITHYHMEDGKILHLIEPPCGSNTCIIESSEGLLVVDGGMCCYKNEDIAAIKTLIPDFDDREKTMILTHSDADHCGIADSFNKIYVSLKSYKDFENELAGKKCYRETSPLHKPYYQICKILSSYVPPELSRLSVLGDAGVPKRDFTYLCDLPVYGMTFEVYEGAGGHVPGELVLIERRERLVFTGDIFVNVKDLTPEQHSFNRIAPYLTTTVDSDPTLARREREGFKGLLDAGAWLLIGGHGAAMTITA